MKKRHTKSFKLKAVEKALNRPGHQTLGQLAEQLGIGYSTLTRWMYDVKQGKLSEQSTAALQHKRPEDWTGAEKLRAIIDTEALSEQEKGRYCREQGLYQHQIEQWKQQLMSKNDNDNQNQYKEQLKALKAENQRLQKELARKEKALAEAAALLVLKKKAQTLFGSDGED